MKHRDPRRRRVGHGARDRAAPSATPSRCGRATPAQRDDAAPRRARSRYLPRGRAAGRRRGRGRCARGDPRRGSRARGDADRRPARRARPDRAITRAAAARASGPARASSSRARKLPHQVVAEVLGADRAVRRALGPELRARGGARPADRAHARLGRRRVRARHSRASCTSARLRVYFSDDVVGVEVGGAVKNVMAIATGISDGLGLGLNARAALITRGLAEITRLGVALGGRARDVHGPRRRGRPDPHLHRRSVAQPPGRPRARPRRTAGGDPRAARPRRRGRHTAREVDRLARALAVDMPITREVCAVLFEGRAPAEAVEQLLARDPAAGRVAAGPGRVRHRRTCPAVRPAQSSYLNESCTRTR